MERKFAEAPSGLKMIFWVAILLVLFSLSGIVFMVSLQLVTPLAFGSIVFEMFSLIVLVILIIGILRPSSFKYNLIIKLLIFDIIVSIGYYVWQFASGGFRVDVLIIVLMVIGYVLVLFYLLKIKDYFCNDKFNAVDGDMQRLDKKFKKLLGLLIVLIIIVPVLFGVVSSINNISTSMYYLGEFENNSVEENVAFCSSLQDQMDKCLVALAAYGKNKEDYSTVDICELIQANENKYGCYYVLERCELIENKSLQDLCKFKASSTK